MFSKLKLTTLERWSRSMSLHATCQFQYICLHLHQNLSRTLSLSWSLLSPILFDSGFHLNPLKKTGFFFMLWTRITSWIFCHPWFLSLGKRADLLSVAISFDLDERGNMALFVARSPYRYILIAEVLACTWGRAQVYW